MITTVSLWKGFLKIHPKKVFFGVPFFFFGWKIAWLRTVDLLPNSLGKQTITVRVGVLCVCRVWGNTRWSYYGLPYVSEERRYEGDGMQVKRDSVPETPSSEN